MKKLALTGSVLLVVAALSCTRELDVNQPEGQEYEFEAVWADDSDTRTAIQSDGTSVWWTVGEEINVFYGAEASGKFTSTNTESAQYARFTGTLPVLTGTVEEDNCAEAFWGVYPYNAANTCDGESVTLTIPANQSATEGTFADNFFPAVGRSNDFAIAFYNVCGGVRFCVVNTGIESVTFRAIGGESLVGKVKVAFDADGKPVIQEVKDGLSEVTVTAPEGGFVPGEYYFAAFLPGTLSNGLKVTFHKGSLAPDVSFETPITVNRSRFGSLINKDEGLFDHSLAVPEAVDLGLSVKWASFNLGATKPEEYGDYYVWAETDTYYNSLTPLSWKSDKQSGYWWTSYKWCMGSYDTQTKYCTNTSYGLNGFVDDKTIIESEDDAAFVNLGGNWRIPTKAEQDELRDNCTWEWVSNNGVDGWKVTGTNGNQIFLPAAGKMTNTGSDDVGTKGYYWSSSLHTDTPRRAYELRFGAEDVNWNSDFRCNGQSIRPVCNNSTIPVESFILSPSEVELFVGNTIQLTPMILPYNATHRIVVFASLDESVATVSNVGGIVTGISPGNATIIAGIIDEPDKYAFCSVTVKEASPSTVPEAVDLGLPSGLKWASCNLGATKPEEYGDYYAWGETEPDYASFDPLIWKPGKETGYSWLSYKWGIICVVDDALNTKTLVTKYCTDSSYGYNGFTDGKTVLDLTDDAAHINLGGKWRMPTKAEWTELGENCTWTWTEKNGVNGALVTGNNGNSIFLPSADICSGTEVIINGYTSSYYWSSSLRHQCPPYAYYFTFHWGVPSVLWTDRTYGMSVRPVSD